MAARELLECILRSCLKWKETPIPLRFTDSWRTTWPCKDSAHAGATLIVGTDYVASLQDFVMLSNQRNADRVAAAWAAFLRDGGLILNDHSCNIIDLLRVTVTDEPARTGFFAQIVNALTQKVEVALLAILRNRWQTKDRFTATYLDIVALLEEPAKLDSELLKHVLATKEATRGVYNFSFTTDKLHTGHFGLVNTILGLPGNIADILLPQVIFSP